MTLHELIQRIGYFRNEKKLSARELSLRIEKSGTYINQIESGNFILSLPMLLKIIDALDISCAEFFSENYTNYKQDKEIINLLSNLSTERKNSFIDLMKNTK